MFGLLALLLVVAPPHFRPAPGWHVGARPVHACPGVSVRRCVQASGWASTVRYRDCPDCVPPHRTLAHLPPYGIVIQLTNARERPARTRTGQWPVRIRLRDLHAGAEGVSNRYSDGQWFVRSGATEHHLFVWFGRAHPTRHQLARANAELRTAG